MKKISIVLGLATLAVVVLGGFHLTRQVDAAPTTVVVTASDLSPTGWFFYQDAAPEGINNSLGTFVVGPGSAPSGAGSAQISTSGTSRPNLATYQFGGTPLASITELKFSTYNASATNNSGPNASAYLQFNVDFNGSDTWQRRLLFLPRDNGTILADTWQEWDAISAGGAVWRYSGGVFPGTVNTTQMTWSQILATYPGVRIRISDPWLGMRVGEPYPNGYTENIDAFKFGTAGGTTLYDFEPDSDGDGVGDGYDNCAGTPNADQADADNDGIGDACDGDNDNDGVADATDNCDFTPNPGQEDGDNDGIGDACDPDAVSPTTADACKKDGWKAFYLPRRFKNQGDCIQYVNTGK